MIQFHKDGTPIVKDVTDLFRPEVSKRVRVIGIVGDPHNGKTNVLRYMIKTFQEQAPDTQIVAHGLREPIQGVLNIHSVTELEKMRNSVIFIDEWADLVDTSNKRQMRQFEQSIRTIYQPEKNNIVILVGMARNFNGKISGMLNAVIFKETTLIDIIQRSVLANVMSEYTSGFKVTKGRVLSMPANIALVHIVGGHFDEVEIPYLEDGDVKTNNKPVVKWHDDVQTVEQTKTQSRKQTK